MGQEPPLDLPLDGAVGAFYAASLAEGSWASALSTLGSAFAERVYLAVVDTKRGTPLLAVASDALDPEAIIAYEAHYGALDPRRDLVLRLPPGETFACHEHFDPAYVRRSEFYNDFVVPYDARYGLAIKLLDDDGVSAILGFLHSSRAGPFTAEHRDRLAAISPHLARGLRLHRALQRANDRGGRLQAMLDRLHDAALLVDAGGRVLEHNRAAERLARDGDGLLLRHGRLGACRQDEAARLEGLINDAAAAAVRRGAGGGACRISRLVGAPYVVMVTPLVAETEGGPDLPAALVTVIDPDSRPRPPEGALRAAYDLTPAEEALALALLEGRRLSEVAGLRGVSVETVRVQLKALLAKTGCGRQAELVLRLTQVCPAAGGKA